MSLARNLVGAYVAGRKAARETARKTERAFRTLRLLEALLMTALVVVALTAAVSLAWPAWAPYAYALGSIVLAIPLVAALVLVWKPLHTRTAKRVERLAHRLH